MVEGSPSPSSQPSGEMDLGPMLGALTVSRRPGLHHVVNLPGETRLGLGPGPTGIVAMVAEPGEGMITVVCTDDELQARGWTSTFAVAWLTLDVHSSLAAVGLTAAVSTALAHAGIPANMLAGFHHDHILVPEDRAVEAMTCLRELAHRSRDGLEG